ncbi:hypothetical protein HNQ59_000983 [Chitinivorax tropicus]|uniref:DUF4034 domain-containing protein n=1 Tax=Chitinivorax tropicus TaxID=714531 RepID=A0A840MEM6_9PROT|nr:hypothetical protein [Chitinivorax tropicus]MBB5017714.1 hypothetical protein [Chitinivorax tropicus]
MKRLAHLMCAGLLGATTLTWASGGWEPDSRFFANQMPDRPIEAVITHPGNVYPEYRIAFLVHAWLVMNNRPLPTTLGHDMDHACCDQYRDYTAEAGGAAQDWTEAAKDLLGDANVPDAAKWFEGQYMESLNCYADAFNNAKATLEARQKSYPQETRWLKDWATGQNTVFENCDKQHVLPADAPANAPTWLKADRAYQQAAALFYQGEFTQAAQRFAFIAKDSQSPWSGMAPYLQARALVRTLGAGVNLNENGKTGFTPDQRKLSQTIEQLLLGVLKDPKREAYHSMARRLLRHSQTMTLPPETLLDMLGASLSNGGKPSSQDPAADFRNDLATLSSVYYRTTPTQRKPAKDDLIQWITAIKTRFNANEPSPPAAQARAQWQQTGKAHWLLAAMALGNPVQPEFTPLQEAAQAIHADPKHPAYLPISLQLARSQYLKQDWPALRATALALQKHPAVVQSASEQNIIKSLLLPTANNLDEFKQWSARQVVLRTDPETEKQQPTQQAEQQWDIDAISTFNALPLPAMVRLAERQVLANEKINTNGRGIWEIIWSRAVLLENWPIAKQAAEMQLKQLAEAKTPIPTLLKQFSEATAPEQWKRLALYRFAAKDEVVTPPLLPQDATLSPAPLLEMSLRDTYPDYSNHKWCELGATNQPAPLWLSPDEKQLWADEQNKLKAIPPDSVYYGQAVMAYAKTSPDDPMVAQMLSVAIKMSRYACKKPEVGTVSKQAFQLLKSKYAKSDWANQTKYWYEGR